MKSLRVFLLAVLITALFTAAGIAAQFTVTTKASTGPGSLSEAIDEASAYPGGGTITFNIPGSGVHVIDVGANPLPHVKNVFIDGYSQPGAHPNTLALGDDAVILIQVDGGGVAGRYGFWVTGFTHIRGLAITGCDTAVALLDPYDGNVIEGNFIGLEPSGQTAAANRVGIFVSTGATIGGTTVAARNVIGGNSIGVGLGARNATTVAGNYIGTDLSGTGALPNSIGIDVQSSVNRLVQIGGNDHSLGNVISGNSYGIRLGYPFYAPDGHRVSNPANYVVVSGNLIGTTADGQGRLGNRYQGIVIFDGVNNTIGGTDPASGNTIAYNGYQGISVQDFAGNASGNRLLSNSIYSNGICGIALGAGGPVPNDLNDGDTGPNSLQNYPIITGASIANGQATINGTLNSTPNAQFTIQFFADSLSFTTPGQTYLGTTSVITDANGNASFSVAFSISKTNVVFDATATNANGDTSPFFYNPGRLANISTRLRVQTGDNALIAGFIMVRNQARVVLRALGPSLSVNGTPVAGRLQDPTLELYDSKGALIATNDNWRDDPNSNRLGSLAPTNDLEAALSVDLVEGAYTAVVRGKNNTTGIGLAEAYFDAGQSPSVPAELANLSTRGLVETGDNVMIGGFIATDSNGPTRFVIRAIGPSLGSAGISNPLADPTLELHDGNGAVIATNDNWKDGDEASVRATGLAPQNDAESVILATLPVGAYTAIVRGKGNATGVALVEVYNLH